MVKTIKERGMIVAMHQLKALQFEAEKNSRPQ